MNQRIASIDVARGLVMLIMTVDHTRETFFMQHQVTDPMNLDTTSPALFFTRLAAHFCAPMFGFLTGLSAWLYAHPAHGPRDPTGFLVKRGLLLIGLEIVVINFAWTGTFAPAMLYLQVMWAIGLAMLALALLHRLPLPVVAALGLAIVCGHNALTGPATPSALWTILEQRGFLFETPLRVKISYPVLAWIGVILLGYACGPLFARGASPLRCRRWLLAAGAACLALLAALRSTNLYGEPVLWVAQADVLQSAMSFLNFTKYPPSLDFILLTLGCGALVLAWLEGRDTAVTRVAGVFGGAPLFYYILHLYVLLVLGRLFGSAALVWQVWLAAVLIALALYWPTRWFGQYKRTSGKAWVKYL
ncbi:MAG: heparan-alpha-glucosaminide N-acetyltransferase domain-containing protein [Pseudomonadota bacterium]|nr:heparan-alpha-glucosaminide N-acetyltransferase domain-containing protein [Pseudomonadota bacterium]